MEQNGSTWEYLSASIWLVLDGDQGLVNAMSHSVTMFHVSLPPALLYIPSKYYAIQIMERKRRRREDSKVNLSYSHVLRHRCSVGPTRGNPRLAHVLQCDVVRKGGSCRQRRDEVTGVVRHQEDTRYHRRQENDSRSRSTEVQIATWKQRVWYWN